MILRLQHLHPRQRQKRLQSCVVRRSCRRLYRMRSGQLQRLQLACATFCVPIEAAGQTPDAVVLILCGVP